MLAAMTSCTGLPSEQDAFVSAGEGYTTTTPSEIPSEQATAPSSISPEQLVTTIHEPIVTTLAELETQADAVESSQFVVPEGISAVIDMKGLFGKSRPAFGNQSLIMTDKDTLAVVYRVYEDTENDTIDKRHFEVSFVDVHSGKNVGHAVLPQYEDYEIRVKAGGGDKDTALTLYYMTAEYMDGTYSRAVAVKKDGTYKIDDKTVPEPYTESVGSHEISHANFNIYDAESEKSLVEGYIDKDNEVAGRNAHFNLAAGGDSFIYTIGGWESTYGIGIYDFSTGESRLAPDTDNFAPAGVHDGKIYSAKYPYAGCADKTVYVTNMETLETTMLFDEFTLPVDDEDWVVMMPESGEYVTVGAARMFVLEPDSGAVLKEYDFSSLVPEGTQLNPVLISDGTMALVNYNMQSIYLLDLSEFEGN